MSEADITCDALHPCEECKAKTDVLIAQLKAERQKELAEYTSKLSPEEASRVQECISTHLKENLWYLNFTIPALVEYFKEELGGPNHA